MRVRKEVSGGEVRFIFVNAFSTLFQSRNKLDTCNKSFEYSSTLHCIQKVKKSRHRRSLTVILSKGTQTYYRLLHTYVESTAFPHITTAHPTRRHLRIRLCDRCPGMRSVCREAYLVQKSLPRW